MKLVKMVSVRCGKCRSMELYRYIETLCPCCGEQGVVNCSSCSVPMDIIKTEFMEVSHA